MADLGIEGYKSLFGQCRGEDVGHGFAAENRGLGRVGRGDLGQVHQVVVVRVSDQYSSNRVEETAQESHAAIDLSMVGRNAPEGHSFEGGIGEERGGENSAISAAEEKSPRAQIADLEMGPILWIGGRQSFPGVLHGESFDRAGTGRQRHEEEERSQ